MTTTNNNKFNLKTTYVWGEGTVEQGYIWCKAATKWLQSQADCGHVIVGVDVFSAVPWDLSAQAECTTLRNRLYEKEWEHYKMLLLAVETYQELMQDDALSPSINVLREKEDDYKALVDRLEEIEKERVARIKQSDPESKDGDYVSIIEDDPGTGVKTSLIIRANFSSKSRPQMDTYYLDRRKSYSKCRLKLTFHSSIAVEKYGLIRRAYEYVNLIDTTINEDVARLVGHIRIAYEDRLTVMKCAQERTEELLHMFNAQYGSFNERTLYETSLRHLNMTLAQEGVTSNPVDTSHWLLADIKAEVKAARDLLLRQNGVVQAFVDGLLLQTLHDERNQLPAWLTE